jgi:energy-coupling factor transport system substrate-specific component
MSWPLAAYGLLGLALATGFAWYERTRPDAKVVALVGTMAALAALGRIAFAAVPNVKPTTDIIIVCGMTLGGAPGFTVGAVAALASNFFFGQGPWTPWQMLGWGLCGVIGALLGRLGTRRWPLAVVCFILGFAFTAFQDFGDWVTYSDHSLAQLGAYLSSGVGFDLISAGSCLGFALLFGPGLARALGRFRLRLNVQWAAPLIVAAVLVSGAMAGRPAAASAALPASPLGLRTETRTPAQYLESAPLSSALYSGWAALGLEADGVRPTGRLIAFIRATQGSDAGSVERSILLLAPLGDPVGALVARLHFRPAIDGQTNLTAFGVLALRAAHRRVPAATLRWLSAQEDADGGFNFATRGQASDIDDTGAVLEALGDVRRAVRFIRSHQNPDGGFGVTPGESSNAQSTAFAVQGLIAAGIHPASAIAYLRARIAPDGSVNYAKDQRQTPEWVTGEALMALAGQPLPLPALPAPPARG